MKRAIVLAAVLAGLLGCAGGDDIDEAHSAPSTEAVKVSSACSAAMSAAAAEQNLGRADELIFASLDACTSADEWMAALRADPGAMGVRDAAFIDDTSLMIVCGPDQHSTAVCSDAAAKGTITTQPSVAPTTTLPLTDEQRDQLTYAWALTYSYDIEMLVISIGEQVTNLKGAASGSEFELSQACVDSIPTLEAAEASAPHGDPDALSAWTSIVDSFRDLYDRCAEGVDGVVGPLSALEASLAEFDAWWAAHDLPSIR